MQSIRSTARLGFVVLAVSLIPQGTEVRAGDSIEPGEKQPVHNSVTEVADYPDVGMTDRSAACPSDTALRTLFDRRRYEDLVSRLSRRAEQESKRYLEGQSQLRDGRLPIDRRTDLTDFTEDRHGQRLPRRLVHRFERREVALSDDGENPDRLVWSVDPGIAWRFDEDNEIVGWSVSLHIKLDLEASVLLGITGDRLLHRSNGNRRSPITVDDSCALQAFASAEVGIFGGNWRQRATGRRVQLMSSRINCEAVMAGAGRVPPDRFCIYDFYTGDQEQFSIRFPCVREASVYR